MHRLFTFHLGIAVSLAWMTSLYAALYAPWVRNIRPSRSAQRRSGGEHLVLSVFAMPWVLTTAWLITIFGRDLLRELRMLKNQTVEFGIAAVVAFALFYLSIDRAVTAMLLGL